MHELTNEIEALKKKVSHYKSENVVVHVSKKNGLWNNGLILEFEGDLITLDDEKVGAMPIYLIEIKDIEKRREKDGQK